ncbi:TcaA 3rd/4th domain-containing protein [Shimazuella kribbensis]|uniref:TcaA 3rd/4th domain-containing protein n=1 Tax=Shimazuella kribbensis TaxID=139808 RepID=UPI000419E869|nr:hypothetical protein [Shimazuella kribbensis]
MEPKQQLTDFQNTVKQTTNKLFPFFRKNKKWSFALLSVVCLIVVAYIAGASLMDPRDKVIQFEQAVHNGDVKTLKSLINSPESNLEVDDKHIKDLITYSKENQEYLPDMISNMMFQINDEENGITNIGSSCDYYLKQTKIPLFYSKYSIEFRPYFLELSTNESGATLKVDSKQVFKTTEKEKKFTLGPLMPGIYKTSAEKKFPYAMLSQDSTISAFDEKTANSKSNLELNGGTLQLESNFENTTIFVNGKAIGKTIHQMPEIGPISFNGTIRIHGEQQMPWGLEKSADELVEESTSSINITPVPFATEPTRKPIIELINTFSKQDLESRVKQNANVLTTIGDTLRTKYIEDINDDVKYKYTWKGKALGTRIDFDNISLSQNEQTKIYEAVVPLEIHAKYKQYGTFFSSPNDPLEDKIDYYKITLSYNEKTKKWLVTTIDSTNYSTDDYFNGKNTIKSEFK